ncbi:hypothetical protein [Streptomyces sp. NPDC001635]
MQWTITPRRRKPNSARWVVDRTEYARRRPRLLERLVSAVTAAA